jgi:hypothetical protein
VRLQAVFLRERGNSGVTEPHTRRFYRLAIPTGLAAGVSSFLRSSSECD